MDVYLFGILEEVTGQKILKADNFQSTDDLVRSLKDKIPALNDYTFQIAINQEVVTEDTTISPGDEIAFLPPFSGG